MDEKVKWLLIAVGVYLVYNEYVAAPAAVSAGSAPATGSTPPATAATAPTPAQSIAQTALATLMQSSTAQKVQSAGLAYAGAGVNTLTPSQWNYLMNQVTGIPGPGLANYGLPTEDPVNFATYWTAVMLWAQAVANSPNGYSGQLAGLARLAAPTGPKPSPVRTFDMVETGW